MPKSNKNDPETMWKHNQFGDISNHLHLNAFYDVLNRVYVDAIVQTAAEYHEYQAAINMAERSKLKDVIFVADRGYENYTIVPDISNHGVFNVNSFQYQHQRVVTVGE